MADTPTGDKGIGLEQVLEIVYMHLGGDRPRIDRWLQTPHPLLNDIKPIDLIRSGHAEKLLDAVKGEIDAREQGR